MTQYFTDFSEYTSDVAPSDWTQRFSVQGNYLVRDLVGATGGKVLEIDLDTTARRQLFSWDEINADANRADAEFLIRYRFSGTGTRSSDMFGLARASGSAGNETGYRTGIGAADSAVLGYYLNGTFNNATAFTGAKEGGTWYWIRGRHNGSDRMVRQWADGDSEPETWLHSLNTSPLNDAGWVGIFTFTTDSIREVDIFSVGTNGDAAPSEALSSGPTLTNVPNMTRGVQATITGTGFGT